jgi:translocation and assembly module TamB
VPDPSAGDGRLKLTLRGTGLGWGGAGVGILTGDATIADPLGRTTFDATLAATALRGIDDLQTLSLKASGDRTAVAATVGVAGAGTRVDTAVKARLDGSDIAIDIDSLKGSRSGRAFALSQPGHIRIAGGRTVIEPMRLTFGGGQVKVGGTLDPGSSDLALDVTALPLADIAALAGSDVVPTGTLQVQVRVRGATANPHIEATYAIRDARVRTIATASVPAASLTGKATLANNAVNADAGLTIGGGTLRIAATGQLPAPGGTPAGQVKIAGPVDLAMFASLLGPDFRDVGGRALIDVTLATRGGAPSGDGSIRLEGIKLEMPSQGIALSQGSGLIRLAGDRVVIERFGFPAVGRGTLGVSGEVRLDPKLTLPVDLKIEATRARLLNSRELVAQLTSSLRISGSVADGLSLAGTLQIDRAEIGVALGGAAKAVPTVPVREVGTGAPKPVAAAAPSKPIKLDLKISAPQAIFVRGKGMDAELAGDLTVTGDSVNPSVLGGLRTRRGTFTFLGRTLNFTRGNVTFISADRIVPILDMLATTRSSSIAVEVTITGKASDPKIVLSSTPQLPQDEIMSHFLFGKAATELGPSQLVQVADALAELTGAGSSGSAIDSVRRGLGLDRLGISQSADQRNSSSTGGNGLSGAGIEGGRYIGRGIYVGGRQGLQGDTRGVVQIEVIPHVKIEGEFGTTSTGRAGVALEYDY